MEFRQFRYILKIAEEGTLSSAAKKLYVSQPSLSQMLAAQEKKIGAPLFDRGGTCLTPTAVGRLYLETARSIIALDEAFHQQVDDCIRGAAGNVTVGLTQFRSTHLLAPMLPAFRAKYPKIMLHLREDTTYRLEELAEATGMDPAKLKASIDAYNAIVDGSQEDEFGFKADNTADAQMTEGPWYACRKVPTVHHTMGGIKINVESQAVDDGGNPIAGLYACGECTGGIHGSNRLGGNAICDCMTFGRNAGKNAAEYAGATA